MMMCYQTVWPLAAVLGMASVMIAAIRAVFLVRLGDPVGEVWQVPVGVAVVWLLLAGVGCVVEALKVARQSRGSG